MQKIKIASFIIVCLTLMVSCKKEVLPKPNAFLKLSYPKATYVKVTSQCPYTLEISNQSKINLDENCWATISYPKLKAKIHLTYRSVNNNLNEVLKEVEKLTFEHTIKANAINVQPFEDYEKNVFGTIYFVEGNVATNMQFRVTDSTKNVLAGALYFYTRPNYDSILPAVKYIENDIKHLIETIEWKN